MRSWLKLLVFRVLFFVVVVCCLIIFFPFVRSLFFSHFFFRFVRFVLSVLCALVNEYVHTIFMRCWKRVHVHVHVRISIAPWLSCGLLYMCTTETMAICVSFVNLLLCPVHCNTVLCRLFNVQCTPHSCHAMPCHAQAHTILQNVQCRQRFCSCNFAVLENMCAKARTTIEIGPKSPHIQPNAI